jgi:benzylsuccinate CoA-transferase BbsF subunit
MGKALQDLRVIDFTWVLAGPFATRILADYGAQVIKVQSEVTMGGMERNADGYFNTWNRNKLGIALNLSQPQGIEVAKRLVQVSDVVVENFSPRVMGNWGLDYHTLRKIKPDLIMLSMSSMGQTGPWRDYIAFGATIQALSGITYLTAFPGRPPLGLGYSYADHVAGLMGALAVLQALEYRQKTGEGQYIDLAELEAMSTLLGTAIMDYGVNHRIASPLGNRPAHRTAAPYGAYRCKGEDRWCAIAVFTEEEWQAFCRVLGHPSWTKEERFATLSGRVKNIDQLDSLVEEWTKRHSAEEVMTLLQEAGVAAGVVQDAADLSQDPQLKARGFFVELAHPVLGKASFDGSPVKLSHTPAYFQQAAPLLGQHNDYVYRHLLGMSEEEIERYSKEGVLI